MTKKAKSYDDVMMMPIVIEADSLVPCIVNKTDPLPNQPSFGGSHGG